MTELEAQFSPTKPGDYGVFGDPIKHSLSPLMQNAALEDWWKHSGSKDHVRPTYHAFHVKKEELREAIGLAKKYQLHGLNITVPHKENVAELIPSIDDFARECGAVNTLVFEEASEKGFNTDGYGFEMTLKKGLSFNPIGKSALILGAGGTGKMILRQLCLSGINKVFLWNRSSDRSASVVTDLKKKLDISLVETKSDMSIALTSSDLVVNATSVGLKEKDGLPAPDLTFSSNQVYFDVIYHRETEFISQAARAGAKVCDGLGMLLFQGARSFEIWTKTSAPIKIMKNVLMSVIKGKGRNSLCQFDI